MHAGYAYDAAVRRANVFFLCTQCVCSCLNTLHPAASRATSADRRFLLMAGQVLQDMIWVWGENGPDAGIESALSTPALVPDLNDAKGATVNADAINQRDVPYGWETLMENIFVSWR